MPTRPHDAAQALPSPRARIWSSTRSILLFGALAAALTIAWAPGFTAPYQYDDYVTPLKDPASQSLGRWWAALPVTLRPLTKLSFAMESSAGLSAAPERRAFNWALFLGCAVLFALLLEAAGLRRAPAALIAALWGLHPVHAELVLALAGRSALLALALMLGSALCLVHGRARAALALAVAAVLARETAWPWLIVATGLTTAAARSWRARWAPPLVAAILGGLLIFSSSRLQDLLAFAWSDPQAFDRIGLQWAAVPHGSWLLVAAPRAFTVDMEFGPRGVQRLLEILLAALMYGGALWVGLGAQRPRMLRIGAWLWLCLVAPLHTAFPKLDPLTARSFSASAAALLLLAVTAAVPFLAARPGLRRGLLPVGFALGLGLLGMTRAQAERYQDPIALWGDAAAHTEHATRPLINLGTLLAQKGRLAEARLAMQEAARRDARSSEARERLAAVDALIEAQALIKEIK
ncbi:MAG: hypothetical protein U1E65_11650 [Myxococcota bacterium]